MGRKERREMERKVKHLQKTKPWELQALIREEYDRFLIDSRMNNEILAPGDKVMIDVEKVMQEPDWTHYKPEYKDFVKAHANEVYTLRKEARQQGPFAFISFEEDTTDPRWLFYLGHVKKVRNNG